MFRRRTVGLTKGITIDKTLKIFSIEFLSAKGLTRLGGRL
jgi:hypothetical protein